MADEFEKAVCPICAKHISLSVINAHVNGCLNSQEKTISDKQSKLTTDIQIIAEQDGKPPSKKLKYSNTENEIQVDTNWAPESDNINDVGTKNVKSARTTSAAAWGSLMKPKSQHISNSKSKKTAADNTRQSAKVKNEDRELFNPGAAVSDSPSVTKSTAKNDTKKDISVCASPMESFSNTVKSNRNISKERHPASVPGPGRNLQLPPKKSIKEEFAPLAERVRPKCLSSYVGQGQAVGKSSLLRTLFQSNKIPSMILWGPPGCGKTTLARIIAEQVRTQNSRFVQLSATTSNVAEVKSTIQQAKNEQALFKRKTLLFIDEIHRFNKLQQDTFLPHVEDGTITLIGATTENPSFQVNSALLSRCRVIVLEKLAVEDIETILKRALQTLGVKLLGKSGSHDDTISAHPAEESSRHNICMQEEALTTLAQLCDGDARFALNALQAVVQAQQTDVAEQELDSEVPTNRETTNQDAGSYTRTITLDDVKSSFERTHVPYDRAGDEHYHCASALQKSIRGSDDSGAIYWLARMLEGGENPLFIARRLVVCASEDIGLADPQALPLAVATFQACHFLGMPECRINLAHCTAYLARAAKNNGAYQALINASQSIREHQGPLPSVPLHLRNASTQLLKKLGYGQGYKYNHDYKGAVQQTYLPAGLEGVNFFSESFTNKK